MDGNHDGVLDRAEFRQGVTEEQCTPEEQDAAMPRTLSEAQARIRVLEGSLGELGALNIALNEELANGGTHSLEKNSPWHNFSCSRIRGGHMGGGPGVVNCITEI